MPGKTFQSPMKSFSLSETFGLRLWKVHQFQNVHHIAFKVSDSEFDEYVSRIKQPGLEVKPGRERVDGEFRSIYFYDYDNHLFELHTGTLQDRLLRYSETSCTGRSEK